MFRGYVRQKRNRRNDRLMKAIVIPTFIISLATFIFLTLKKAKPAELKLEYPTELKILNERINTLDSMYNAGMCKDSIKKEQQK